MNSCASLLVNNTESTWYGYVTYATFNDMTLSYCRLTWIYLPFIFSILAILLIYCIWRNSSKRKRANPSPIKTCEHLKSYSANTLADYVADSPAWRVIFYLYGVLGILFGLPIIHLAMYVFNELLPKITGSAGLTMSLQLLLQ